MDTKVILGLKINLILIAWGKACKVSNIFANSDSEKAKKIFT